MLISTSRNTDERFPQNESVRIENGEPILSPLGAKDEPEDLKLVETWIKERMEHVEIIDALVDTEHWLHWTRHILDHSLVMMLKSIACRNDMC